MMSAIQYRVRFSLRSGCGVLLSGAREPELRFPGGAIDPRRFFRIRNLTRRVAEVAAEADVPASVGSSPSSPCQKHRTSLPGGTAPIPSRASSIDRCNPPRPDDHIGYLPRLHASAEEELEELGVESIHDIPDDFELTEIQRRAATCVQTGEPWLQPGTRRTSERAEVPAVLRRL